MTAAGAGRPSTVHVIVTCANRKSRPIPPELQLGEIAGRSPSERARRWITRLAQASVAPLTPAIDLYAGEHWSVARGFSGLTQPGETVHLWACSAGYGLIPAEALLMPYHATWTRGQDDSVPGDAISWWSELASWAGPVPGQARTIQALVVKEQAAVFMLLLSKNYLRACSADIVAARTDISDPNRLLIVSSGSRADPSMTGLVPADARLQAHFGGTRRALNARIGAHLLSAGIRGMDEATEHMSGLLAAQPPIPRYNRKQQSDREILDRIASRLTQDPTVSASYLLREFRDAGIACEQHRFSRLFRYLAEVQS